MDHIQTKKQKIEKNILKYYLYRFFVSFSFTGPIFILFLQENGISMTGVMVLNAAFTGVIMLGVVPFGALADRIGRKKVLIGGVICLALAFAVYSAGKTFFVFLIGEILFGLGIGMFISSGSSFFYDSLKEAGRKDEFKKLYGKALSINNIMWALGALLGSVIAVYSLRLNFLLSFIPVLAGVFVVLTFTETKLYKHQQKHYLSHIKEAALFCIKHPRIRFFILYGMLLIGTAMTVNYIYQPYLKEIGVPIILFGILYALMNFAGAFASKLAHRIEYRLGEKRTLLVFIVVGAAAYTGFALMNMYLGILLPLVISFAVGVIEPTVGDYINKHVLSNQRATVSSLNSLMIMGFSTVLGPLLGMLIDAFGLQATFVAIAAGFISLLILLAIWYKIESKKIHKS